MRLPSSLRIKNSRDFARVRAEGRSFPGRYLVLSVLRDDALDGFRFGLITPRKLGTAVTRNAIRRKLREIIRAHRSQIASGNHVVVIARWKSPSAEFAELDADWRRLAARAGILERRPAS